MPPAQRLPAAEIVQQTTRDPYNSAASCEQDIVDNFSTPRQPAAALARIARAGALEVALAR